MTTPAKRLGEEITRRLGERGVSQNSLKGKSGYSTIRNLMKAAQKESAEEDPGRPDPRTLYRIDRLIGWQPGSALDVWDKGEKPRPVDIIDSRVRGSAFRAIVLRLETVDDEARERYEQEMLNRLEELIRRDEG